MPSPLRSCRVRIALVMAGACAAVPLAQAEIYKWVDAQGRTHYGERPADAGVAPVTRVKVVVSPDIAASAAAGPATRPVRKSAPPAAPTAKAPPPRGVWNGHHDGTDASRCALARDVLSGAVRHRNGKPTDAYDREVAQNDVRAACGAR